MAAGKKKPPAAGQRLPQGENETKVDSSKNKPRPCQRQRRAGAGLQPLRLYVAEIVERIERREPF